MPTFEYSFSEAYFVEAMDRMRRCRGFPWLTPVLLFVLLCLIVPLIFIGDQTVWAIILIVMLSTLGALLIFARRIDRWNWARSLRKSPFKDSHHRVTISPDGLSSVGSINSGSTTWGAYTAARQFKDGFLLFQGPNVLWLPTDALTSGTREEVEVLLREHITDYRQL